MSTFYNLLVFFICEVLTCMYICVALFLCVRDCLSFDVRTCVNLKENKESRNFEFDKAQ